METLTQRLFRIAMVSAILASCLAATDCSADNGSQVQALCFSPCTVQVSGTLLEEHRFGPPNFGETPTKDEDVRIFVLQLDRAYSLLRDESLLETGGGNKSIDRIQLVGLSYQAKMHGLVSTRVTVRGKLEPAVAPLHFLPFVLEVEAIVPSRQPAGP